MISNIRLFLAKSFWYVGSEDLVSVSDYENNSNNISSSNITTINHTKEKSLNFSSESSKTIDSDNTSTNIENCEYIGSSHFKRKDFDSKIIGNGESLSSRSETLNAGYSYLKEIKLKNINRVSIGQININSLRNKFESLNSMVNGFLDILLVT